MKHVLNWGGLRGSLSLALALSLPLDFPGRQTILIITFGVVFFSLVVQGLTISPVVRFFGLQRKVVGLDEYEALTFELQQALTAHKELEFLFSSGRISPQVYEKIKAENIQRADAVRNKLDSLHEKHPELLEQQENNARKKLLYAEHQAVEQLISEGILSPKVGERKKQDILEKVEGI